MLDIEIQKETPQKLLHRKQVLARLSFMEKVPSRIEVRKMLANKLGTKEDVVIVNQILPMFGTGIATVRAEVYDAADAMPHLVDTFKMTRHLPKEEKTKIKDDLKSQRQAAKAAKQADKKTEGKK